MKKCKLIIFMSLTVVLGSCEIHDFIDEKAQIGQRTSNTYWEIPSTTVKAGENVPFMAQFFNCDGVKIDHMEVWYEETQVQAMSVTCPNIVSVFTKSLTTSDVVHVLQKKMSYEFKEELWDENKRNYFVSDFFSTSSVLKPVTWKNVAVFDENKFDQLFPDTFVTAFRRDLYLELEKKEKYSDLRKLVISLDIMDVDELKNYTDSAKSPNSNQMEFWIKEESKHIVKAKYDAVPFKDLIYDSAESVYRVEYTKDYTLDAIFKVFDKNGNVGVSENKIITLN